MRRAQHLFARKIDLFDRTIEEFIELAFKRYHDVCLAVICIDLGQLRLIRRVRGGLLDKRVRTAEEVLEDLVVVARVRVPGELVHALGHPVLQTVLAILVVDSFHEGVGEDLVRLAKLGELVVGLCFALAWVPERVVLKGQFSVSGSDLLAVSCWGDLKRIIVPGLIVVHLLAVSA